MRSGRPCFPLVECYLHFIHPVHNVKHFLEYLLQPQVHLQTLPPGPEQFQQVFPEPDDIVLPRCNALDVMVVLCFKFPGHGHHSLDTLFICSDVCLNGLVLFGGGLNCRKVKSEVVLQRNTMKRIVSHLLRTERVELGRGQTDTVCKPTLSWESPTSLVSHFPSALKNSWLSSNVFLTANTSATSDFTEGPGLFIVSTRLKILTRVGICQA